MEWLFFVVPILIVGAVIYAHRWYVKRKGKERDQAYKPVICPDEKLEYTKKQSKVETKRRLVISAAIGTVLLIVVIGIFVWNSTSWKRDFQIQYVGYEDVLGGVHKYKIKNLTNNTYRNVRAVFSIENVYGNLTVEDYVGSFEQGEEVEYNFYFRDVKEEANKQDIELFLAHVSLEKLYW